MFKRSLFERPQIRVIAHNKTGRLLGSLNSLPKEGIAQANALKFNPVFSWAISQIRGIRSKESWDMGDFLPIGYCLHKLVSKVKILL
jgi:hypothetical protein